MAAKGVPHLTSYGIWQIDGRNRDRCSDAWNPHVQLLETEMCSSRPRKSREKTTAGSRCTSAMLGMDKSKLRFSEIRTCNRATCTT